MFVIGVDTDSNGYVCVLSTSPTGSTPTNSPWPTQVSFFKIPVRQEQRFTTKKRSKIVDTSSLVTLLNGVCIPHQTIVYYEFQTGRAGGFSGAFTFARNYGHILSALELSNIKDIKPVSPQKWKRYFDLIGKPKSEAKDVVKHIAIRYNLPINTIKPFGVAKADAFLIAWYGWLNTYGHG